MSHAAPLGWCVLALWNAKQSRKNGAEQTRPQHIDKNNDDNSDNKEIKESSRLLPNNQKVNKINQKTKQFNTNTKTSDRKTNFHIMVIGDGQNDQLAINQADVGVAITSKTSNQNPPILPNTFCKKSLVFLNSAKCP